MRECTLESCENKYFSSGYCMKHYSNFRRKGYPERDTLINKEKTCIIEGCDDPTRAKGLCSYHYFKFRKKEK